MIVLALDTATPDLVTGVVAGDGTLLGDKVIPDTRMHSEQLMPTVQRLLEETNLEFSDLGAVVVGCGPGPFTGLRIGMATATALADALKIPVYGVCSLDAIADAMAQGNPAARRVLVATDARRKEIYYASFELESGSARRVLGPEVGKPEDLSVPGPEHDWVSIPEELAPRLPEAFRGLERCDFRPRAAGLVAVSGVLRGSEPAPVAPLYLRRPDAKVPAQKPRSSAIPNVEL